MFTGIVECVGRIVEIEDMQTTRNFVIRAQDIAPTLKVGDSVSVDGACLTAITVGVDTFSVDVIGPTLDRTIAASYKPGCGVNLERAMRLGERIDGHLVQGHVDCVGTLRSSRQDGEFWLMDFAVPEAVLGVTVEHGSITLNGVSLTVSDLPGPGLCRIGVIPFTHEHTNLGTLEVGEHVNIEGDMIGKYVAKILANRADHRERP
ncbi:MAG: riboflavin synthase [Gemmatimonadetes bacterium]|jgi:riboflavin synthase|nr:riboflavin synthase [Gemmatimonadota bacterium]